MITFDKLITISGNRYSIRTDSISDLKTLFDRLCDINTMLILVLRYGTEVHTVDIGRLLLQNINLLASADIHVLIGNLTPEMIYSYRTELFSQHRVVRTFINTDLPGECKVSPYNINTRETVNTMYDLNHRDLLISCAKDNLSYNLSNVIPVIGGKLRYCNWDNGNITLEDQVDLLPATKDTTFVSFDDTTISLKPLSEIIEVGWTLPSDKEVILVLGGSLFFDIPHMYTVDRQQHKINLNIGFISHWFGRIGIDDIDGVLNDRDSFVIITNTDRILTRDLLMIHVNTDDDVHQFVYYEDELADHHVDYICIDNKDYSVRGITTVDEKYYNVVTRRTPREHHVYAKGGSGDMRLIQMVLC